MGQPHPTRIGRCLTLATQAGSRGPGPAASSASRSAVALRASLPASPEEPPVGVGAAEEESPVGAGWEAWTDSYRRLCGGREDKRRAGRQCVAHERWGLYHAVASGCWLTLAGKFSSWIRTLAGLAAAAPVQQDRRFHHC